MGEVVIKVLVTAGCRYEGLSFTPSRRIAEGTNIKKDMMVMTEKRLILSKVSYIHIIQNAII